LTDHVIFMGKFSNAYKILTRKPEMQRAFPRLRYNSIKIDLTKVLG
jgi:hypothetical protein